MRVSRRTVPPHLVEVEVVSRYTATAIAMQRNDHPPGYRCCDLGTVVLADDVKRQVDRGSCAGGGEHLPIVNVEPPWIDLHRGIARCQFCRPPPVRADAPTIQHSAA